MKENKFRDEVNDCSFYRRVVRSTTLCRKDSCSHCQLSLISENQSKLTLFIDNIISDVNCQMSMSKISGQPTLEVCLSLV